MKLALLKIQRILARLNKIWKELRHASGHIHVVGRVAEYREMWRAAAEKIGAGFTILADDVWELELDGKTTRILNHKLQFDDPVTLEIAGMKPLMYRLFREHGLPVPEHIVFRLQELDNAYEFLKRHPKGCVIKPANGTSAGIGVTTHIMTKREARKAAVLASLYCRELIMEPMIPGECYRILVLDGTMIHAVRRRAPRLRGDGISKVSDLIEAENARLRNQKEHILDIDRDCLFTLDYQNLTLDSIPAKDQTFAVKSVDDPHGKRVEVRTVYNETVTHLICDSLREAAEMAAKILGSRFVGVDFITIDCTVSLQESGGFLNEVNTTPGMHHHYNVETEKYAQPALQVLKALLGKAGAS